MQKVLVSVIIPVYNTAQYLEEAIGSVLSQTFSTIEVIAVNDGSLDNSLEVLHRLAGSDDRLKVISYDKNAGVSVCRNTGLEVASGEYVYFFDSDDIIEPDCLELCVARMQEYGHDFLVFDGMSFSDNGMRAGFNASYQRTRLMTKDSYTGAELMRHLIKEKSYSCSVCLCFIRRDFLQKNRLTFYPGVLYEDVLFAAQMYLAAEKVGAVARSFFHRRVRENSTMTSKINAVNIGYRLTVGTELLKLKKTAIGSENRFVLNHQTRNLFVFLVKSLIRNRQFELLLKYLVPITSRILRSL